MGKAITTHASLFNIWNELKTFWTFFKIIKKLKAQNPKIIVHTHSSKAGFLGRLAAFFAGAKAIIHTVHGFGITPKQNMLTKSIFWLCEQIATLISTKIICVSEADIETGSRLFFHFSKKAILIRAAVDPSKFPSSKENRNPLALSEEKKIFTIGSISCLKPQKNLFDLIKGFALLKKIVPKELVLNLEILGDGIERSNLQSLIKELGLETNVKLMGWHQEVSLIMKKWDVFCLTSLWEGLPCALVEARILKIPCICYDTGGIKEILHHDQNGFLIKSKNPADLAFYLYQLIINPFKQATFKAFSDQIDNFYEKQMLLQHKEIYKQMCI